MTVNNKLEPKWHTKEVYVYGGEAPYIYPGTDILKQIHQYLIAVNPYPTAFPYGNGMVLHFYQQQESSTTKTVHKVINKGLKGYV